MIGYGPDIGELRLRTADFIARLFAGANPAEMPFERPTHFEMAINNKVAHSIGITIPPSVYVRADEVIE
jgi:putative ABC transport system substrate-binding protein